MTERGRSMTEMVGMLTIMGILSVIGIWAYKTAMNKHYANEILQEAHLRAVACVAQIQFGHEPSLSDFSHNTFVGGSFDGVYYDKNAHQFALKIKNMPNAVCQNILNSIGNDTSLRRLSDEINFHISITNCNEGMPYLMYYNEDMSGAKNDTQYCTDDSYCQTLCGTCNSITHLCENECEPPKSECMDDSECSGECVGCVIPRGQMTGTCQICKRVQWLKATGNQYIKTGINISETDDFIATYTITLDKNSTRGLMGYSPFVHGYWGISSGNKYELGARGTNIKPTEKDDIVFERTIDTDQKQTHKLYINNHLQKEATSVRHEEGIFSIFAIANGGYKSTGTIWAHRLLLNGILVRDFVPVIAPTGEPCMFDKISKGLFCNSGSGTFKTNQDD